MMGMCERIFWLGFLDEINERDGIIMEEMNDWLEWKWWERWIGKWIWEGRNDEFVDWMMMRMEWRCDWWKMRMDDEMIERMMMMKLTDKRRIKKENENDGKEN